MPCGPVDGMVKVAEAMTEAIERARRGDGPTFSEKTITEDIPCLMLNYTVLKTKWKNKKIDPITQVLDLIKDQKYATEEEITAIEKKSASTRMR
jgi:pyruvate dehydrogenase E1 component alpha subunit